jgi:NADPH-dependent curcumin reductase CurA
LKSIGVDAAIDYKKPEDEVVDAILSATGSSVAKVYDAVASNIKFAVKLLGKVDKSPKLFTTTNDW